MYSAAFIYRAGDYDADFHALNDAIDQIARASPGFLGAESWVSVDGATRNATYYWSDLETLRAFSTHPKHLEANGAVPALVQWFSSGDLASDSILR